MSSGPLTTECQKYIYYKTYLVGLLASPQHKLHNITWYIVQDNKTSCYIEHRSSNSVCFILGYS